VLDDPAAALGTDQTVDPEVVDRVRQTSFLRAEAAWERSKELGGAGGTNPHQLYRQLRLAVVAAERAALLDLRTRGTYPSRILSEAQAALDLEETRFRMRGAES
jgi:hypothetical protein